MKVIPWILVAVFAGGCLFLFSQNNRKESELIELRAKLEGTSVEGITTSGEAPSGDEWDRIRRDAEEVYKLRGEIAQLRRDNERMSQHLTDLGEDPVTLAQNGGDDALMEDFPPLTPEEEQQQKLELEHAIACVENLKVLEEAKTKWVRQNRKEEGQPAPMNEIMPYVPNQTMPICPSGGTYVFNEVGVPTSCSVEGHSLLP